MHYGKRCGPSFGPNNGLLRVARIPVNYLFGKSLEIKFVGHSNGTKIIKNMLNLFAGLDPDHQAQIWGFPNFQFDISTAGKFGVTAEVKSTNSTKLWLKSSFFLENSTTAGVMSDEPPKFTVDGYRRDA
ncbi:hypothetical protein B0H14DRAFT_2596025 [Mycena olivaceomarginata]|nr:hypothetical protein B0H14DRAFT_2596025 [Mycena olivaceomarginata]